MDTEKLEGNSRHWVITDQDVYSSDVKLDFTVLAGADPIEFLKGI